MTVLTFDLIMLLIFLLLCFMTKCLLPSFLNCTLCQTLISKCEHNEMVNIIPAKQQHVSTGTMSMLQCRQLAVSHLHVLFFIHSLIIN